MQYLLFMIMILIMWFPRDIQAFEKEAGSTALLTEAQPVEDPRVAVLEQFFEKYNPKLTREAIRFIEEADQAGIDWKLVPAISGVESTFCRFIPSSSYNCWGWGIPTGASDGIHFDSFANGIHIVSQGLRQRYYNRGLLSIEQIGRVYAASPTWAYKVRYFMNAIDSFQPSKNTIEFTL